MTATLCLLGCQNLRQELSAVIAAEGWPDVVVRTFPARCGHPPLSWDELRALLPEGCTQVALLGCACLAGLGQAPADFPPVRLLPQEQCFNMVVDACLITEAIAGGGYLMTPGWLADWRGHLAEMGFTADNSGEFFKDFARMLVLFDTGVDPKAEVHLGEFAHAIGLPARRIVVGLDHIRMLLALVVLEWRLDGERRSGQERDRRHAQELADHIMRMDLILRLVKTETEAEAIAAIEELFRMLFAPATWYFMRVKGGALVLDPDLPADMLAAVQRLESPYAWTPSGQGFLLRISRGQAFIGVIVVDRLAFPEHRERYLNLVLAMTGLLALAVEDARYKAETKIAISALRTSESRLRSIMDNTSNVVFIKDLEGRYLFVNRCYEELFHVTLEAILGKTDYDIFPPETAEHVRQYDRLALEKGGPISMEEDIPHDDGVHTYITTKFPLISIEGKPYAVCGIATDITVRKQAEEAQRVTAIQLAEKVEELERMQAHLVETERLRAMGQMAAGVAHDFNNALMKVLGQSQLMRLVLDRGPVAAALQGVAGGARLLECLARQEQAAFDAGETVRKIRGATRPRDTEEFEPVSLGEIVEQALATTKPRWKNQAEAAGVRITVQTALTKTPPVLGHAAELREALTNLFFNALDAMPQGGTLTITTRLVSGSEIEETRAPDPGALIPEPRIGSVREWVELSVTDTGVGMPPEVQARLFEPFFTTKGVRGTGLGLSMVKGIIGRHEGKITVQSAEGQGTTFTLRLPVAHVAVAEVVPPPTAQIPLSGSLNILVIDDEPLLAETLGELLRILGHEAAIVTSGEEGLTRLATTRFDLVLTDLGMPGMSGWEVAQAVKASWTQLPVILVTGWGDALESTRLEGTGVDLVLAKPYTVVQLKHALVQGVARP